MAYLDDTGLAYFWGKIKAWANSVFALVSHTHPSSDVTLMTGYSKPSSGSAVAASDTLNQAVGKLEAKVDVALDDSNYVHLTGNENIAGIKTFTDNVNILKALPILLLKTTNITRNTVPSSNYAATEVLSRDSASNNAWALYHRYNTDKTNQILLICYKGTTTDNSWTSIGVGYDSTGTPFTVAPTPPTADDSTQIATTAFVKAQGYLTSHQSLSNYVTLNSAQTITGTKTVTTDFIMYDDDPSITFKYKTPARGTAPSTGYYTTVADIKDKNGYRFAGLYHEYLTNRGNTLSLIAYNGLSTDSGEWSRLQIGYDNSGTPFTTAVNPPAAATDNRIATCKWVTDKGYLTSHQSLASCVKTSGNQDIAGYKVFTTSLTVKRTNPYLYFIETDATKGGTTSTDFQGVYFCDKNFDSTAANDNYTLAQIARVGATANENMVVITAKTNTASTNTGYTISFGHTGGKTTSDWYLLPSGNGVVKLGSNAHRWGQIYSSVSTISTSDARVKNSVADVSGDVLDAWDRVGWKQFKFNSSVEEKGFDAARLHTGVVAQDIESVFAASGLDARRYGLFCYDEWEAEVDVVNSQGSLLREGGPAGSLYSVRYEEALCMEAAYMRRENARLKKRVADLEDRLAALELRLGSE